MQARTIAPLKKGKDHSLWLKEIGLQVHAAYVVQNTGVYEKEE